MNTHPFDLNLSRFVPNSVQILPRNFKKKTILEEFFIIFHANKGYPLPKLMKFHPTFGNFYFASVLRLKIHTSTFICCLRPGKEALP